MEYMYLQFIRCSNPSVCFLNSQNINSYNHFWNKLSSGIIQFADNINRSSLVLCDNYKLSAI